MKAILVVDLEANELPKDAYANIYVFGKEEQENRFLEFIKRTPLKPLPSKRKSMVEWVNANVKTHDLTEYDKGWNDCVDYMEGGEQ